MRAAERFAWSVLVATALGGTLHAAQALDRREVARLERALRLEGEAIVAVADRADEQSIASDFALTWRHDFFKAQKGTFVPFVIGIEAGRRLAPAALMYVRVAARGAERTPKRSRRRAGAPPEEAAFAFEEIYPLELTGPAPLRIARGFSVAAGDYDVTVVVRERDGESSSRRRTPLVGVLRQQVTVPDYSGTGLMTSSVILADELSVLPGIPDPADLVTHPYVVGSREIHPSADAIFGRGEELIVVFLVYNPAVTPDKQFDLEVEYHFFMRNAGRPGGNTPVPGQARPAARPGETYFNRTEPQRFNPLVLGPQFDPAAGHPVMAGQGVPLTAFQPGEYRLAITVTDRVSRRTLEREVMFTVRS